MKQTAFKYIWIVLLLLSVNFFQVSAQWKVGVMAGYTRNELSTSSGYFYDRDYQTYGGFTIGVPVRYEFKDWFALQADLSYVQKNYRMTRGDIYENIYNNTFNGFIELPVYAKFSFGGSKLKGFLNLGAYSGVWVASRVKGEIFNFSENSMYKYNESVSFDSRRDNRFDGGLLIGIGLQYSITEKLEVFAEGRYYYGLTDLQRNYMEKLMPRYNNTLVFQAGCMFKIGSK